LIRTMKLVGATDAFVRRPFLVEGMAQGVIAGLISGGIVGLFYRLLADYLPQLQSAALPLGWVTAGVLVGVGIVLGWLGSFFAVRRFIKNVPLH
jgi:cell division transport system permease protein